MSTTQFEKCSACAGRGYHNCDCWPCDCICGIGDMTCEECGGEGLIDTSYDDVDTDCDCSNYETDLLDGSARCHRCGRRWALSQQGSGKLKNRVLNNSNVEWDIAPSKSFFEVALSMSRWQIFWGGNYFDLPPTRGVLVWDKEQPWPNFSQAELAWTNLDRPAAMYRANSGRAEPNKVHPTQKPVGLMSWCLTFIPEAQVVLDPFMGSGTTGVACTKIGRTFIGIERHEPYFEISCQRIRDAYAQPDMLVSAVTKQPAQEQISMFGGDSARSSNGGAE